jgi:hypothetical protein
MLPPQKFMNAAPMEASEKMTHTDVLPQIGLKLEQVVPQRQ